MLLLVIALLVTVPPIVSAVVLLIQSLLLWRRRMVLRAEMSEAAAKAHGYLDTQSERAFTTEAERQGWRFSAEGDLRNIWWQSPLDYITLDDYTADVNLQSAIDRLARRIAAQRVRTA